MNLIKLAFVIIISIHLGAPTFAQSCVDRGYDNDYTPMFGGKTYCTKEETGSYEKKTPKLNHDTNPPGIDTYDKENTFMILASTLTPIMMPTWMAEQTLNGKNNITQTCQVTN